MLTREILRAKRDGEALSAAAIQALVAGIADGQVGDEQLGAFTMAVFLQGMNPDERLALTLAMRDSGRVLSWQDLALPGPVLDKHSTGGLGDGTSFLIGPWVAACGGYVPMISGRGLGHTGGTLDKLASIPGYDPFPGIETLRRRVRDIGVAIIGQTADLAPADRRCYAVRDTTATVESLPLIVASILSKKLAEGLNGLVLDVKTGVGAVMSDPAEAARLARALVETAAGAGVATRALLTDMSQALGRTAGNALEVAEIIAILRGEQAGGRLFELSRELAAEMLLSGDLARDRDDALTRLDAAWGQGQVAERFQRMVSAMGGPSDLVDRPGQLAQAPVEIPVFATEAGIVQAIDVRALGLAIVELGGGRRKAEDAIDPAVGFSALAAIGEAVDGQRPLLHIHARSREQVEALSPVIRQAFRVGYDSAAPPALIGQRLAGTPTTAGVSA